MRLYKFYSTSLRLLLVIQLIVLAACGGKSSVIAPEPGRWEGQTSEGRHFSFYLNSQGVFQVVMEHSVLCIASVVTLRSCPQSTSGGRFDFQDIAANVLYEFSGNFNSSTSVDGTVRLQTGSETSIFCDGDETIEWTAVRTRELTESELLETMSSPCIPGDTELTGLSDATSELGEEGDCRDWGNGEYQGLWEERSEALEEAASRVTAVDETHPPLLSQSTGRVLKVWFADGHPMTEKHWMTTAYLRDQTNKVIWLSNFGITQPLPNQVSSEREFSENTPAIEIVPPDCSTAVTAYTHCNQHGLSSSRTIALLP